MKRLHYSHDTAPGISRLGSPKRFRYVDAQRRRITSEKTLERIRLLAIPPAWTSVWICPSAEGHIQATGRDQRGRKQYRYHSRWSERRSEKKFDRMIAFAQALPTLRRRIRADLKKRGLPREKALAAVVRLLQETLIRVGNEEYARTNRSFGLTTLRNGHAHVRGDSVRFRFRGKSGIWHDVELSNKILAACVRKCQELPGQHLFEYLTDDGKVRAVTSTDVNRYLQKVMGGPFGAKDFRTWHGSLLAASFLAKSAVKTSAAANHRVAVACVRSVAEQLRNTPSTCRKYYIHPALFPLFETNTLPALWNRRRNTPAGLTADERALAAVCRRAAGKHA